MILLFTVCGSDTEKFDADISLLVVEKEFTNPITGVFLDSAVENLEYVCSSGFSGVTNEKGEFTCEDYCYTTKYHTRFAWI